MINPVAFVDSFDREVGYKCKCGKQPVIKVMVDEPDFKWFFFCRKCLAERLRENPEYMSELLATLIITVCSDREAIDRLTGFIPKGSRAPTIAEINELLRKRDGKDFEPMKEVAPGEYMLS